MELAPCQLSVHRATAYSNYFQELHWNNRVQADKCQSKTKCSEIINKPYLRWKLEVMGLMAKHTRVSLVSFSWGKTVHTEWKFSYIIDKIGLQSAGMPLYLIHKIVSRFIIHSAMQSPRIWGQKIKPHQLVKRVCKGLSNSNFVVHHSETAMEQKFDDHVKC